MEAEKSHDLPSVSWRPRKAGDVIQSKFKGPETRRTDGPSPILRTEENGCFRSKVRQRKREGRREEERKKRDGEEERGGQREREGGKDGWKGREKEYLPFLCVFVLFRSSVDWMMPS